MNIRLATPKDEKEISILISLFRAELKRLKGTESAPDIERAKVDFREYVSAKYPIFVAEDGEGKVNAYLVCKIIDDVVWVESLFVSEQERRKGIATSLYHEAEKLAQELGALTLYNWVHPNNDKMISFLSRLGYDVLNLIEVRKKLNNEVTTGTVKVGDHKYNY